MDSDDETAVGQFQPALAAVVKPPPPVSVKRYFSILPAKVRVEILKHCVRSPNFADNSADALVGPTISQKGRTTDYGRYWKWEEVKPFHNISHVCHNFRQDAARLVGQVNIFKIKYPTVSHGLFDRMGLLSKLTRLDLTLITIDRRCKKAKYKSLTNGFKTSAWVFLLNEIKGSKLKDVRINFAESDDQGTGNNIPFFVALSKLDISETLTFDGSYPEAAFSIFLPALQARNPEMVFSAEGWAE